MAASASRKVSQGRAILLTLVLLATGAVTLGAWLAAAEAGRRAAETVLDDELRVLARSVSSEIERFRYLPSVIGRDGRIHDVLHDGGKDTVDAANRYLKSVRGDTRADELYVMNLDGLTLAASNHDEPTSFLGENYRFRPYFKDALAFGEGRYYAVGVTTGRPGYFLASAIRADGVLIGVAVVKVDMSGLETAWAQSRSFVSIADTDGVVFLTGNPVWRYRPLGTLSREALAAIDDARKYDGIDLAGARPIFGATGGLPRQAAVGADGQAHLLRETRIEPEGWVLLGASSLAPIHASANLVGLVVALLGMLVSGAGFYLRQRRQLVRAKLERHDWLERRVAERTADLAREVEERKRAEEELRSAQETLIQTAKLAALGRMSAAIVHEVSQPLSAIENTLATTGVLAERGDASAVGTKVRSARDLVRRIQRTVKLLRSFARKEPVAEEPVNVERSVAAVVDIAQHKAAGVTLSTSLAAPDLWVKANAVRLEQVVLNLVVNALDAVRDRPDPHVEIAAYAMGDEIIISVSDNGTGIPDDLRERIAEPFFTTKQTAEGLGLGLSISRAIIGEFGGSLTFESEPGAGSVFTVSLRRAEPAILREAAE